MPNKKLENVAEGLKQASRISAFVSTIITTIIAAGLTGFIYFIFKNFNPLTSNGLEQLFWWPILIIVYILNASLIIGSFVNSIIAIKNKNIALKIISILMLLISIALIGFNAFIILNIAG